MTIMSNASVLAVPYRKFIEVIDDDSGQPHGVFYEWQKQEYEDMVKELRKFGINATLRPTILKMTDF